MRSLYLCVALALTGGCAKRVGAEQDGNATVVVIAKRIRTMDPARPFAEALAMRGGKFLKVGTRAEVLEAAGSDAVVDELKDTFVVPGLADAHGHLLGLGQSLSFVNLFEVASEADAVARMKTAGPSAHQGAWVRGNGWDQNRWPDKAFPTRASLDSAFPEVPVYLTRVDGHAAWLNSAALRLSNITKATKDPEGGRIVRDAKGEPTGVLVDNAMDLPVISAATTEQGERWLKAAIELCIKVGLTSVHDAGMDVATFQKLQDWDAAGVLPIRVYAMAMGNSDERQVFIDRGPFKGRHLVMRAAKLLADGALGSRGAALFEPYADEPGQSGLLLLSKEELSERAHAFAEAGFQIAVHAIGDRANAEVLDVLESLPPNRNRIEHVQVLRAQDVPRFKQHEIIASFQPTHATSDMPWAGARLGEARLAYAYAWRSLLDSGAHIAFGSDFPIEKPDPLLGLYAARTRQDANGQPAEGWHPEQRVSGLEALAGFTTGAAYAEFSEERRGMIKEGFDADFTGLSLDPVEAPAKELIAAKVLLTVVDGVDVYRSP